MHGKVVFFHVCNKKDVLLCMIHNVTAGNVQYFSFPFGEKRIIMQV